MAATFMVQTTAQATASARIYFYMRNTDATLITRIRRVWVRNTFTGVAFTGGMNMIQLSLETGAPSGGTAQTPRPYDTTLNTLTGLTATAYSTAITGTTQGAVIRQFLVGNDERTAKYNTAPTIDDFWGEYPFQCVWDSGYGDSNIQPLTLRQNEGFSIRNTTVVAAGGGLDFVVEFTHS
jgi:hypothetical protein